MNAPKKTWMHNGYFVLPVPGSYRRAAGGYCVDVRSDDDRCPISYWTANANNVLDEQYRHYWESLVSGW